MLGGIGNVVLLIPSLRNIRESAPHAEVVLLTGEKNVEGIIANEHLVDRVICLNRKKRQGVLNDWGILSKVRQEKFDLLVMTRAMNPYLGGLFAFFTGIKNSAGENRGLGRLFYSYKVPFKSQEHEIDGTNRILNTIGVETNVTQSQLKLSIDEDEFVNKYLTKNNISKEDVLVGMHVGSGGEQTFKRWNQDNFITLGKKINDTYGVKIILTGGPAEIKLVNEVASALGPICLNASGHLTIRQTAALVKRCQLFISNDSGLAHIAAAVNVPLIVLFGKTEIHRIVPRGDLVKVIKKEAGNHQGSVNEIHVDDVFEEVQKVLN